MSVFTVFILRPRWLAYSCFQQYRNNNKRLDISLQDKIFGYFSISIISFKHSKLT
jgi:hypothetical protein